MNIAKHDLNLLVYLDVLLRERNVSRAADRLSITQPAMSNGLKRLRAMFNDPLLVRTTKGMEPTQKALSLQPVIHQILMDLEVTLQGSEAFQAEGESRLFRLMVSDYAASTILPPLLKATMQTAPGIKFDLMNPSDVGFSDIEDGKVDLAINLFDDLPQSFHKKDLWQDQYCCLVPKSNPGAKGLTKEQFQNSEHVWVSKTGYGVGVGINIDSLHKHSSIDHHLEQQGAERQIKVFTRDYHVAVELAAQQGLIVTLPLTVARKYQGSTELVIQPLPFDIPEITLQMVWSPLLQHDQGHKWLRQCINDTVDRFVREHLKINVL